MAGLSRRGDDADLVEPRRRAVGCGAAVERELNSPGRSPLAQTRSLMPPHGVESDSLRLSALKLYLHRVRFCVGALKRQDNPGIQTCDVLLLQRGREGV